MVFALMAVVWGVGWAFGQPLRHRMFGIGLIWAFAVLAHLSLPSESALRGAIGGSAAAWLVLGGIAGLVILYRAGLAQLRARSAPPVVVAQSGPFGEVEIGRYARHILLREIGGPGQVALKQARILVIGAGGLGSPALLYLAAAGVGTLGIIDDDEVESSNLQRQIIHDENRLGMAKVFSAQKAIKALNPFVNVRPYHRRMTPEIAAGLLAEYDMVLDGTDNFDTRYLVNRACVAAGKPLISGAITQWEGQVSLFDPARGGPCYECVFPERPLPGMVPTCAEAGVAAPLPGIIGAMMAMEAVKHLTGAGETLRGRLMIHDALYAETRVIGVKSRADCACCAASARQGAPEAPEMMELKGN